MNLIFTKARITAIALFSLLCITVVFVMLCKPPIKIGVMFSQQGSMAANEEPLIEAIQLAVKQLNSDPESLLLGRKIEIVLKDGKSDDLEFEKITKELMAEGVDVIFGCWTSSCRKHVVPIIEDNNHLLYYPLQYEGIEDSPNVIYLGEIPNQQMIPALEYAFGQLGKRIYLVGSDYIFPRTSNQVISYQVDEWGGEIVGKDYARLGSTDFTAIVSRIKHAKPDVIFNMLYGVSNASFFRELRKQGVSSDSIPSFSFSVSEDEVARMDNGTMAGDFVVWSYLESLDNEVNKAFVSAFKKEYGDSRVIGSPMATAYSSVFLWARAVKKAGSSSVEKVREAATDISFMGPAGMLYLEEDTRHTWKSMHVAKIGKDDRFHKEWSSGSPIKPKPFYGLSKKSANAFLDGLKSRWNGNWGAEPVQAPSK
jgi:urea transport system substrate-binding protein